MLGGRHGDHHPQALRARPLLGAAVAALLAGWPWAPARADVQKIAPDGTVHRVDVEASSSGGATGGTVLRHTQQKPGRAKESSLVPGTEDPAVDREPALDVDPVTGTPVLVWSRNEGTSYDVMLSRYDNGTWVPFVRVTQNGGDETRPEVRAGRQLLHVVYRREDSPQPSFYRTSFDRATLKPVYGPEMLPVDGMSFVPPEGESSPGAAAPPADDLFFSADVLATLPGDPDRIIVWGVRDEPVPIDYRQGFLLPSDAKNLQQSQAAWVACRFALWFLTPDRFYYTSRAAGRWHEDRTVDLSPATTGSDARVQLEDMIRKADGCLGP